MPKKKFLLICNDYPSRNDIYKNGFIHRRVKSYQKNDIVVVVFCVNNKFTSLKHENYDGVNVVRGNQTEYQKFLKDNDFQAYLIHFISKNKYEPIVETKDNPRIIIWIHGAEAETWHRRWFDFITSKKKLNEAVFYATSYYPERLKFLNSIYTQTKYDITFIYVSKWFKENVADVDAKAAPKNYRIIPNVIDDSLFRYEEKQANQRMKILSIRPFTGRKYANDLTVDSILELSKRPFFNELEFSIYGDGAYFDEILEPIKKFKNVSFHKRFLTQVEISKIHKKFGVFVCPTRWDSQGVSMCEAMSSGLVPISSNNTAIPEFVKHNSSGLLSHPGSGESIANQIERLYKDEILFKKLSYNAAQSIRELAGESVVISKELDVILGGR